MKIYTFSQARQQLASLLEDATREGEVQIRRRDGRAFVVQPIVKDRSPLDVPSVSTDLTTADILSLLGESRRPRAVAEEPPRAPEGATKSRHKKTPAPPTPK